MGFYYKYFHEYCFLFTPPVGLTLADDVTEGFPLALCVPSRALQGNYMCMLDNTSKTLVKLGYLCGVEGHFQLVIVCKWHKTVVSTSHHGWSCDPHSNLQEVTPLYGFSI